MYSRNVSSASPFLFLSLAPASFYSFLSFSVYLSPVLLSVFPFLFLHISDADSVCIPSDMDNSFIIRKTFHLGQVVCYTELNLSSVAFPCGSSSALQGRIEHNQLLRPEPFKSDYSDHTFYVSALLLSNSFIPSAILHTNVSRSLFILATTAGHTPIHLDLFQTVSSHMDQYSSSRMGNRTKRTHHYLSYATFHASPNEINKCFYSKHFYCSVNLFRVNK